MTMDFETRLWEEGRVTICLFSEYIPMLLPMGLPARESSGHKNYLVCEI